MITLEERLRNLIISSQTGSIVLEPGDEATLGLAHEMLIEGRDLATELRRAVTEEGLVLPDYVSSALIDVEQLTVA
jgi:hypothetical protein